MSTNRRFSFHFALCLVATTAVASAAFLWLGLTPVTAVLAAVALGCPLAAFYAWWLTRRALRPLDTVPGGQAGARRRP